MHKPIDVEVRTLDSYFEYKEISFIDIIEIDIEGFKYSVLKVAKLTNLKPIMIGIKVEIHFDDQYHGNLEVEDLMTSYGYRLSKKIKDAFVIFFCFIFVLV